MEKVLIVVPKYNHNRGKDYTYNFPLGLAYISSTLKSKGYFVDCINLNHKEGTVEELVKKEFDKKDYDYVMSGGNAFMFSELKKIIETAKKHKTSPITFLGGPIITSEPELMFDSLKSDFGVLGEGEEAIIDLLKNIHSKGDFNKVKGIIFRKGDKTIITPMREPIKDIEKIPYPDFEGVDFREQLDNMHCNDNWNFQGFDYPRTYPILGSRGCPFNCTFCWHDVRYRARSIPDIMKELKIMIPEYNINNIMIYDDCFSASKERISEFCSEMKKLSKKLNKELKWHCQLIVSTVDEEKLKMMKEAGCEMISYGFESFSPVVLKSMRKPITPEKIDFAFKETLKVGIGIQGNFIFGDIAETKETAKETLDYWKKNAKAQISLGFVEPYPGSEIYRHCLRKGIIKDKFDFIQNKMGSDARVNMTEKMTDKEIKELSEALLVLFSKYAKFVKPISIKNINKKKKIYQINVKCPYCKQKTTYKNCFIHNRFTYGFHLICRKCKMRFVLVSEFQRIAYKFYTKTRSLRDKFFRLKNKIKQRTI